MLTTGSQKVSATQRKGRDWVAETIILLEQGEDEACPTGEGCI